MTFANRAFLPRRARLPSFTDASTSGKAIGALLRATHVAFFGCHRLNQLSMKSAIEMSIAFYLPTSDNVTFTEVRFRPTAESVSDMTVVNDEVN